MKQDNDLVSVIVPIYNAEKYLTKCVKSIIDQTYGNIEIILIDDGSSDASAETCDRFSEVDPRIRVVHKDNGGLSSARNLGLDIANGQYVIFVDSDDYIDKKMIEVMKSRSDSDLADMVICGFSCVDEAGSILDYLAWKYEGVITKAVFWDTLYSKENNYASASCAKLYKKGIFEDIRYENGKIHEDEFIIHKIIHRCKCISVIKDCFYYYLKREGSITRVNNGSKSFDRIEALIDRVGFFIETNQNDLVDRSYRDLLYSYQIIYNQTKHAYDALERAKKLRKQISRLRIKNQTFIYCVKRFIFCYFYCLYNLIWLLRNGIMA